MAKTELESTDYGAALGGLLLGGIYLWALFGFLIGLFISLALFFGVSKNRRLLLSLYLITPLLYSVAAIFVILIIAYGTEPELRDGSYPLLARRVIGSLIFISPISFLYWLFWDGVKIAWIELRQR